MHKVIAISREFGSGGRSIGHLLSVKLGIPYYDSEIVDRMIEKTGFSKEFVNEFSEDALGRTWMEAALVMRDTKGSSIQDQLWFIQKDIIKELAHNGPCVFVGRCADYILQQEPEIECISVFIHSSMDDRVERIVERYGETKESPKKRLRDKDKRRSTYYQYYTYTEWGNVHNYMLSLDSGKLGLDKCVELIANVFQ